MRSFDSYSLDVLLWQQLFKICWELFSVVFVVFRSAEGGSEFVAWSLWSRDIESMNELMLLFWLLILFYWPLSFCRLGKADVDKVIVFTFLRDKCAAAFEHCPF